MDSVICMSYIVVAMFLIGLLFAMNNQLPEKALALQMSLDNKTGATNATNIVDNGTSDKDEGIKIGPEDLPTNEERTLGTEIIADNLHNLTPEEIAEFPLHELSSEDLVIIFKSLSIEDLEKTLSSITSQNLKEILNNKVPEDEVGQILNRLPQDKIEEILHRIQP